MGSIAKERPHKELYTFYYTGTLFLFSLTLYRTHDFSHSKLVVHSFIGPYSFAHVNERFLITILTAMSPFFWALTSLLTYATGFFHRFTRKQFWRFKQKLIKKKTYNEICKLVRPPKSGHTVHFKSDQ